MKISIIGAGPAGSFAAYLLAEKFNVEIFENHSEVGLPVQCSGLVTESIRKIDDIFSSQGFDDVINNKISKVRLFSKNEQIDFTLKNPDLVLKREKFDKWLASLAEKRGAKINLNSRFLKVVRENGSLRI